MSQETDEQTVAQALKQETEKNHLHTEGLIGPQLAAIKTRENYAKLLSIFYGYFNEIEKLVREQIDSKVLADIGSRRTSQFIIDDLNSLGLQHSNMISPDALPKIDSVASALGAMYVLEGSTLGGKMIRKMLLANPHAKLTEENLSFFNGYGAETGIKWKYFVEVLNNCAADKKEIIASANKTFELFSVWIKKVSAF